MPKDFNFKVNENITLKLENNKTNIYIKGELFRQCKFLLMIISVEESNLYADINSIDDAAEILDMSLVGTEGIEGNEFIPAEERFWAHCSNLQAWCEHSYNTRLLHSNLAFPLLRKLEEIGDPKAKTVFKEEIANRFLSGNSKIQDFLLEEGYLDILSKSELLSLVKDSEIITKLEMLIGSPMRINTRYYPHPYGFVVEKGEITWLSLDDCSLRNIPNIIKNLSSLKGLILSKNSLVFLPDWIVEFRSLEYLDVSNNKLEKIPESIGRLQMLKWLKLNNNKLREIPDSIGDLAQLAVFFINGNMIKQLPNSIGKLESLKDLVLKDNLVVTIPDSIGYISSLKRLDVRGNPIRTLPNSISKRIILK
ncbi:hypothetical protein LCGC14_0916260 [marine sediment metagenome]|uniref:Disease resistance R13L4/SHOC-2-like LRR domain-containing protein n=1 Tax=marine sediment metagenome TaxID=412755 RepID=A0A0F9NS67_9ZZZZ